MIKPRSTNMIDKIYQLRIYTSVLYKHTVEPLLKWRDPLFLFELSEQSEVWRYQIGNQKIP